MRKRHKKETTPPEVLCQIAQEGGPEGDLAFGELLALVDRHIHAILAKFYVPGMTAADLYQEALYCLRYRVIPVFDPSRAGFVGYTRLAVRRHLCNVLEQADCHRNRVLNRGASFTGLNPDLGDGDQLNITNVFEDSRAESPLDRLVREERNARLLPLILARLTPVEARVIEGLQKYGSYAAVAEALGVSVKAVDNARVRVRKKANELLKEERRADAPKGERDGRGDGDSEERVLGG
jgi:RNA polymerase sigma factor (sigma-70 family)